MGLRLAVALKNNTSLNMKYLAGLGFSLLMSLPVAYAGAFTDAVDALNADDYPKAAQLFAVACDGGNKRACFNIGLYANGQGVKQDLAQAAQHYTAACAAEISEGCFNLGILYYEGTGVKQDKSAAKALFKQICSATEQRGCAAYRLLKQQGVQ